MATKEILVFDTLSEIKAIIPKPLFDNLMEIIIGEEEYEDHDYTT